VIIEEFVFKYMCVRVTVDGRNPAPPGKFKKLKIMGETTYQLSTGAGFLPSTVPYVSIENLY